ncbi:hypothetical protein ASPACDRAFT_45098 [Aspergillus aculeatus ATCC 16872]|uniref:Uncharacterized protein n=1 Tax=Aspergillus aculeatus (strain ATCC 16872 / CBS 172.66 / WB 5094) TaxID=690307 RepID=A0A1L9WNV1_ASPA1|nr:uncharacterized protein ASPACDRAFT_45098 [Aspergillus aculeatus ATCC 16872]OJJ97800.1 hypothetical protein ASPACDRAFT_45098 [Aspergillus aculeatus ATCC 16872]
MTLDWDSWRKNGYLHIPEYLNYLEGCGIGERVQNALTRYAYDSNGPELGQKCYDLLREMIQQDPLYYALIVECRPDKESNLVHRSTMTPSNHHHQWTPPNMLGHQHDNDIQSSILLPTLAVNHLVNLVPGSHTEAQSPLALHPSNVTLNPGDLIIMMPTLRRAESTFSASALLNLSQAVVGGSELASMSTADALLLDRVPGTEALPPQTRDEQNHQQHQQQPCEGGLDCASALGEALTGHRDWNDPKVTYQCNIVLGTDHGAAMAFVTRIRERLALDFHETLDMFENSRSDGGSGGGGGGSAAALWSATTVNVNTEGTWPEFSPGELDLTELFGVDSTGNQVLPSTTDLTSVSSLVGYGYGL